MARAKSALKLSVARKPRRSSQSQTEDLGSARAELLVAAKRLFARQGLSGTSIRDIAQAAGLNSSLISYYFGGKEGLYRTCLQQIGEARLQMTRKILQVPNSIEEFSVRIRMYIENLFELHMEDRDAGLILLREYDRLHSPAEKIFSETFLQNFDLIIEFFEGAQKNGIVDKNKDAFVLASILFGAITSQMQLDHLKEKSYGKTIRDPEERRKIEDHIIEIFKK